MTKQLISTLMILGLLLTAGPVVAQKAKIRKAQNHIDALDYQSAIDILLPLAEGGDNAEVATMLGMIFRKQNSYGKAAVWYEKAVATPDVTPSAYYYYGMMLLHTDKCRQAQEQFDYFLSLQPLDPRQFMLRDACAYRNSLVRKQVDSLEVSLLNFNSVLSDIGPAFYRSGLVFGSVRSPYSQNPQEKVDPFYDLYYVESTKGLFDFGEPESFSSKINSRVHEAIVTFNADASKIYFTRNQGKDNEHSSATATGLEIVYAVSEDGNKWSDLQLLPFNSPKYSIAHPSLSPDGQMLFFASDMPGGFGGKDIYVSSWEVDHWGAPVNLGPLVNTEGDEMFPFYHPSGKLYFSSDGQVGLGGQDLFSSSPNKAGVWDNIENIGAPLNTEYDDYGIIVAPDGSYGYFTSNRPGGKGKDDIYGFRRIKDQPEEEVLAEAQMPEGNKVVVHVQVIDAATGERINNPEISNCEVNLYRSVGTSSFQMNLAPGDCCEVFVGAPGYLPTTLEVCGDPNQRSRAVILQRPKEAETVTAAKTQPEPAVVKKPVTKAPPPGLPEKTTTAKPEEEESETVKEPIRTEAVEEAEVVVKAPAPTPVLPPVEEPIDQSFPLEKITAEVDALPLSEPIVIIKPVLPPMEKPTDQPFPLEKITAEVDALPLSEPIVVIKPVLPPVEEPVRTAFPLEWVTAEVDKIPLSDPIIVPPPAEAAPAPETEKVAEQTPAQNRPESQPAAAEAQEMPRQESEEILVRASRETQSTVEQVTKTPESPVASSPESDSGKENVVTVANETEPNTATGVVEETTEIVRQTTSTRRTTKYLIGTVYDPLNSRPIPYATIHMLNSTCGVNIKVTSDASGHYRLPLVADCCINIRVEKEGFQTYTALEALCTDKNGRVKGSTSLLLKPEAPKPKPKEVNRESDMLFDATLFRGFERSRNKRLGDRSLAFVLNVYYESARTSVKEESVEDLMKLLRLLEENPTLIVEIGAHTDSRGTNAYNEELSQRRAENVVKFLVSKGINERRLIAKGYGESQLINDCDDEKECTEAEHQINRRTEFRVIGGL